MWRAALLLLLVTPAAAPVSTPIVLAGTVTAVRDGDTIDVRLGPAWSASATSASTPLKSSARAGPDVRPVRVRWAAPPPPASTRPGGRALRIPPNLRHAALLATLEAEARAARRGLWGF